MSPHKWDIARGPLKCQRSVCTTTIGAGEPFRWVSNGKHVYCALCANEALGEEPPANLPALSITKRLTIVPKPTPAKAFTSNVSELAKQSLTDILTKATTAVPLDYGQRAANDRDREQGEDG
jgi:hypothetical protein